MELINNAGSQLWKYTASRASYRTGLEESLTYLRAEMEKLETMREYILLFIQEEYQGMTQSIQLKDWLTRFVVTQDEVKGVFLEYEKISRKAFRFQSSYYKLGKKSTKLLNDIQELLIKGEDATQMYPPPDLIQTVGLRLIPMQYQNLVGIDSNLQKVLTGLEDDNVGIIGLYGMGGVGKTTLLKIINNGLCNGYYSGEVAFDCGFWVKASRNATIETIQRKIMSILRIPFASNKSVHDISDAIYNCIKNKRYILMLDDVWEMLDLFKKVGIPRPDNQNKSKIIFTTRSKGVCSQMGAQLIVKVECLPMKESLCLFEGIVWNATESSQIESYAIKLAEECKGLPLALITIRRFMSGFENPHTWAYSLYQLQNCPVDFPRFESEVFASLQLSYDNLDISAKLCFLYCSLFPKDCIIRNDKLVNLWMAEGYLDRVGDIRKTREYGYTILAYLKDACLLESGNDLEFESVKMHNIIRAMALKIAGNKFLTLEKPELIVAKNVEKIALYNRKEGSSSQSEQEQLTPIQKFPKLSTFLCKVLPKVNMSELFKFISNVRVLDLSESIDIRHLPEVISNLKNLEYLDISNTGIRRLPKEMKSLSKLKYLLMNCMLYLEECPTEIVSSLKSLLVFCMDFNSPCPEELLRGLQELPNIQEISICIDSAETTNFLLKSEKLLLCTTHMQIRNTSKVLRWCPNKMKNLETLFIRKSNLIAVKCAKPTTLMVFSCLRSVHVLSCDMLGELDILAYAPYLIKLEVGHCQSIQRILHLEKANSAFLSLNAILLDDLPSLEIISNKALSFPSLETIEIQDCPKLRNPFNDMMPTNKNLRKIKADRVWWDSLLWIDRRHHYSQYFPENTDGELKML